VNIGNFIQTMIGGNAQGVGQAEQSEVSQVVNDPGLLTEALEVMGEKLIDAVKADLRGSQLRAYMEAVDELKAELRGGHDERKVRRLLGVISFMADIDGSRSEFGHYVRL
jgi:hypothetical protein